MWMIIQYIKYCNAEDSHDSVEQELFLKVNSLYAVFKPLQTTKDFDEFIADQLNHYYHEQIRKCYLFNKDPEEINWSKPSHQLLGYLFFKYAGNRVFKGDMKAIMRKAGMVGGLA